MVEISNDLSLKVHLQEDFEVDLDRADGVPVAIIRTRIVFKYLEPREGGKKQLGGGERELTAARISAAPRGVGYRRHQ